MTPPRRNATRLTVTVLILCLGPRLGAQVARPGSPAAEGGGGSRTGGSEGASGAGPGGQTGGSGAEAEELPDPLGGLFDAFDPGRAHRRFDELLGLDPERSSKPRAPELPLAVFVESIRPLGALKYENQLNYFVGTFTGSAPTLQTLTYEYVFADWNAARIEIISPRPGQVDAFGLGYQRTFGVGRDHNWAHGALVLPEVSLRGTGFVGGSALYTVAWKPEQESPWTIGLSAGANRASLANRPLDGAARGGDGSMTSRTEGTGASIPDRFGMEREDEARVWRPFASGNLWYTASPELTFGVEGVAYAHSRFGEYLVQPNLTWRPAKHFFVQLGIGWYEVGGRDQGSFMCRVNLINPSSRKPREDR